MRNVKQEFTKARLTLLRPLHLVLLYSVRAFFDISRGHRPARACMRAKSKRAVGGGSG